MDRPASSASSVESRLPPWLRTAAPWLSVVVLNARFVLPAVIRELPRQPLLLLRPCGDALVIVALCAITAKFRYAAWVRRAALTIGFVLWLYMWICVIGLTIVRQEPLLYDQLFLAKHVGVLIMDLWSVFRAVVLVFVLALLGFLGWLGLRLFRWLVNTLASGPPLRTGGIALALLVVMVGSSAAIGRKPTSGGRYTAGVVWTTPAMSRNLGKSMEIYARIQRGIEGSPYARYRDQLRLERKPDVQLFLVESYGRILFSHPELADNWRERLEHYGGRLEAKGWHVVSGFSQAPVSGGGSWMAEATLLTGIKVRYESVFRHLVDDVANTPNLVRFLDANGYETMLLAPKDRARPGAVLENRYAYDTTIFALDLEYDGPSIGWGIIPDQYSLGFAHENYFSRADGPIFTNFHMVSSHAPWSLVPSVVDDWRVLGEPAADEEGPPPELTVDAASLKEVGDRMRHFRRFKAPRYAYMGEVNGLQLDSFAATIDYDLEVLTSYLESVEGDKLAIIMGDHQPPLVSDANESYDVPVHVFSRDPQLLEEFRDDGFVDGMVLNNGRPAAMAHEAMFSMVVRALVRCCGEPGVQPPRLRPDGIRIGN